MKDSPVRAREWRPPAAMAITLQLNRVPTSQGSDLPSKSPIPSWPWIPDPIQNTGPVLLKKKKKKKDGKEVRSKERDQERNERKRPSDVRNMMWYQPQETLEIK